MSVFSLTAVSVEDVAVSTFRVPTDLPAESDGTLAGAADVLQADATRCEGITGLLVVDGLCEAVSLPLSTHCAPSIHAHLACAAKRVRHLEYFHDHVRIEQLFFDGVLDPRDGALHPDLSRNGLGLEVKRADVRAFATS
jgi:L-alanine-DL-glutamate epimerase-like enolase superfamily enzyme